MSLLSQVTSGKIEKPYLVLIHGAPGVGKSTFAADAPKPIFLCTEDGTSNLDVHRFPAIANFEQAMAALKELATEEHEFKTLCVDSLDHLEPLVFTSVCKEANVDSIEKAHGGYGKGYVAAIEKWRTFLDVLTDLRNRRRMNIIMIAHSQVKKVDDLKEGRQYDRYSLKLNEKASALLQEFCDTVLFATHQVFTKVDEQKKVRAYGDGSRIVLTEWRPFAVAKNRYGLPPELALSWEAFVDAVKNGQPASPESLLAQIENMLPLLKAKDETLFKSVKEHVAKVGNDAVALSKTLNRLNTLAARG